ncbi:hypothetical protein [Mycolicibacterium mengxianglii]|uniref:hypothetical protein n=1 Tax=Mycolicibacterium mengxianglii TaxID=2736649 RepID=UPI0018D0E14A|nr:hypothetical protein [Mycolicibacterium mengxianglii]
MADKKLPIAALVFAALALVAGGLQLWAFFSSQHPRHAILAVFALSVGLSVGIAGVRALRAARRSGDHP